MNYFRNFAFHNIIGHPLMQILMWVGKNDLAKKVHDNTLPEINCEKENIEANTELDDPEMFRVLKD